MDRPRSVSLPVSVALFSIGLIAIVAVFALYATGHHDLPLWLNLSTMLAPVGFVVGVVAAIMRARRDTPRPRPGIR
jgi:hypothetical protein